MNVFPANSNICIFLNTFGNPSFYVSNMIEMHKEELWIKATYMY